MTMKYTQSQRAEVIKLFTQLGNVSQVAVQVGIPRKTVSAWIHEAEMQAKARGAPQDGEGLMSNKPLVWNPRELPANSDRVKWLELIYREVVQRIWPQAPDEVTVNYGFPSSGGKGSKRRTYGECQYEFLSIEGVTELIPHSIISVHPGNFTSTERVVGVMLHEAIHAFGVRGHGSEFEEHANVLGFEEPYTDYKPREALVEKIRSVLEKVEPPPLPPGLGDFEIKELAKQTTRMLKLECGCVPKRLVRASRESIERGPITCGVCGKLFDLSKADKRKLEAENAGLVSSR